MGLLERLRSLFREESEDDRTRSYSQTTMRHQRQIRDETGIEMRRVWDTVRNGLVCETCAVLNGMPEEDWRDRFPKGPPAHDGCRCSTTLTMDEADEIRAEALARATAHEITMRKRAAKKDSQNDH
jgi:hypothetical protein